ncbi:MAG TPA: hypothetical protein VFM77_06755 [Terriglobales bacterium]|nr:hypothetical protein [Terriglobales bacterium]
MSQFSRSKRILNVIVPAVAILLSVSAWAADAAPPVSRASLELQSPVNVAGTTLQSGKYRVEWTSAGEQVEVKIYRGNKEVVSTHARLLKDDTGYDHLSYTSGEKGAIVVTQISFAKQKSALRLENASTGSDAQRAAK